MSRTPKPTVRWTLKQASEEFGVNIQVLTRKLKSNGVMPGDDKMFSTRQVFDALTVEVDLKKAQLENIRRDSALKATRDSILKKENVPVILVEKIWSDFVVDLRQKIQNSNLSAKEKADILTDLQNIPVENYFVNLEAKEERNEEDAS